MTFPDAVLPDSALRWIHARIGATGQPGVPADDTLRTSYLDSGLASQVALDVVESQLKAILEAGPASYNVSGVYQEDFTAVINGLTAQINRLKSLVESEKMTIAAGVDPWAPVTESTAAIGGSTATSGRMQRACSSWDR